MPVWSATLIHSFDTFVVLQKLSDDVDKDNMSDFSLESYDRLSDGEIAKLQLKLARLIVVFFELLHLLITRNRQILLDVMQERKKTDPAMPSAISMKSQARSKSGEFSHARSRQSRAPGPRSVGSNDMSAAYALQAHHSQAGPSRKHNHETRSTISLPRPSVGDEVRSDESYRRMNRYGGVDDQQSVTSFNTSNPGNDKRTG